MAKYGMHNRRSGFGLYLNRKSTFPEYIGHLRLEEREEIIKNCSKSYLLRILYRKLIRMMIPGYQLKAAAMIWKGDGTQAYHDIIRSHASQILAAVATAILLIFIKRSISV